MTFKDLKVENSIYTFDRTNAVAEVGKVLSVSAPHYDARNMYNAGVMVVDVAVEVSGKSYSYTMRSDAEVAYNGNIAISTNQTAMLGEIRTARQSAEQALAQIEKHKDIVSKCNRLLTEFDPAAKSKAELEQWQNGINKDIADMKNMFQELIKEWRGGANNE